MTSAETPLEKFQTLLRKLFQVQDAAELDFGIYRILNLKRTQVEEFINDRLPVIVDEAFRELVTTDTAGLRQRLDALREEIAGVAGDDAFDDDGNLVNTSLRERPKGREYADIRAQLAAAIVTEEQKTRVYNDLYSFFSRYYDDGDFITTRRIRYAGNEAYAIPYSGEEVVLHWATKDQYYVKTTEQLKNYRFHVRDYSVAFEVADAAPQEGNNRERNRRFVLCGENPVEWDAEKKTLKVRFEYRALTTKEQNEHGKNENQKPQDSLNREATVNVLTAVADATLKALLATPEGDSDKSLLLRHLNRFTRRNTSDYFIHKNLRAFLERELDYFIKSECMLLDELVNVENPKLPQAHLMRARVVRRIAGHIIGFLAQVEEFQKKLFEKRKFVLRTEYCITLNQVPEAFWPEILANDAQLAEWRDLFALDDLLKAARKHKPDTAFLQLHPTLVVDTKHFSDDFKWRLLARFDNLDEVLDGLLVKSENSQALNLLLERHRERVKCVYIDPPFNTGSNEFLYKNNYLDSTWLAMLADRVRCGQQMLSEQGCMFVRIDHHGDFYLRELLDSTFGCDNYLNQIVVARGRETAGSRGKLEVASETLFLYSRGAEPDLQEIVIPRPVSQTQWTAFLMGGERHPRERVFLGKTLTPPDGQHWTLAQPKVDALLTDHFLRVRCLSCGALYFRTQNNAKLHRVMRKKDNRWKYYDITAEKVVHGTMELARCAECGEDQWTVDYLGAPTENVSNLWLDIESYSRTTGFFTENSESLLKRAISLGTRPKELVVDYFLGSGTTTAVSHKLGRKWLGIESEVYFDKYPLARMKNVLSGNQQGISREVGWSGGGFFAYSVLEQYDDALENITIPESGVVQTALELYGDDYLLKYMLDLETRGSASLLNVEMFKDPFDYRLKVQTENGNQETAVDLVETFNYLLGLDVRKLRQFEDGGRKYRAVLGDKKGKSVLVVWRSVKDIEENKEVLLRDKEFIEKRILPGLLDRLGTQSEPAGRGQSPAGRNRPQSGTVPADSVTSLRPDRLFVNGASFVEGAEAIEPEFKRLMFAPLSY